MDLSKEPWKSTILYSVIVAVVSVLIWVIDTYVFPVPFGLSFLYWSTTGMITSFYIIILIALVYFMKTEEESGGLKKATLNTIMFVFIYSILLSFVLNLFNITSAIVLIANTLIMMYYFYKRA
ncbi:MAG: hypothetical protein ACFFDT_35480 [Candidatus Hodarchaeota archaeon]